MEQKILELRAQGLGYKLISKQLGIKKDHVRYVCNKHGAGGFIVKAELKTYEQIAQFVQERLPNFEYAGNYTGCDGTADIRCLTCGTVMTRSMGTIRHRNVKCRVCESIERERNKHEKAERQKLKQIEAQEKKAQRFWSRSFEQIEMKQCPTCRAFFIGRSKYCSDRCAMAAANQKGKDRRLRKIRQAMVDNDITLDGLIARDGNVCHICGGQCDKTDSWRNDNGVFIAGDNYPSIDHVIPLARGGLHKWDNVKLAHRRCNYLKRDKTIAPHSA